MAMFNSSRKVCGSLRLQIKCRDLWHDDKAAVENKVAALKIILGEGEKNLRNVIISSRRQMSSFERIKQEQKVVSEGSGKVKDVKKMELGS